MNLLQATGLRPRGISQRPCRFRYVCKPRPGKGLQINEKFVTEIFNLIHVESIKKQTEVMDKIDEEAKLREKEQ